MATLADLRRRVSEDLMEPFVVLIPGGSITTTALGTTTTAIIGTGYSSIWTHNTSNAPLHWHVYFTSGDNAEQERFVTGYDTTTGTISFQPALSAAVASGVTLELHTRTTATLKNRAINDALERAWPTFYSWVEDEVIIPDVTPRLTSTHGLETDWKRLVAVQLEPPYNLVGPFTATSVTTTTATVSSADFDTNAYADWEIRFVSGDKAGAFATVSSNTSTTLTFPAVTGLTGTPDFYLAETDGNVYGDWLDMAAVCIPEGGATFESLLIGRYLQSNVGRKLRLKGLKVPAALDDDADTTDVPTRFIVYVATSLLAINLQMREPSTSAAAVQFVGRWSDEKLREIRMQMAWRFPPTPYWGGEMHKRNDGWSHWASNPFTDFGF